MLLLNHPKKTSSLPSILRKTKKRKKSADGGAWTRKKELGKKTTDNTLKKHSPETLLSLMNSALPRATRFALLCSTPSVTISFANNQLVSPKRKHFTEALTPSKYQYSSPLRGTKTSFIFTPKGSRLKASRHITFENGDMAIYLPEDKIEVQQLQLPAKPNQWIKTSPVPLVCMNGIIDECLTQANIEKANKIIEQRKVLGENPRGISQDRLMKISATTALRKAGITMPNHQEIPKRMGHWVHFYAHSLGGPQNPINLGLGTCPSNAANTLLDAPIKELLEKKIIPALYLSVIPTWEAGFEAIRLLKELTFILRDGPANHFQRSLQVTFDMKTLARVCLTEVPLMHLIIKNKFTPPLTPKIKQHSPAKSSAAMNSPSAPLLSPAKSWLASFSSPLKSKSSLSAYLSPPQYIPSPRVRTAKKLF